MIVEISRVDRRQRSTAAPGTDQGAFSFDDDPGMGPAWSQALTAWVDTDPRIRMIVSRSGRIFWANEAANRMLGEGGLGFRVWDQHLIAENAAVAAKLTSLLADAPLNAALFGVTPQEPDQQWMLWAQQLIPGNEPMIGLAAHRVSEPVSYEAMLRVHHLTPSETQILTLMLAGVETGRIAQRQEISIETLRTHVKHAYRKLNVKSRGELFAKAVNYVSP